MKVVPDCTGGGGGYISDLAESIAIHGHGAKMPTAQCQ